MRLDSNGNLNAWTKWQGIWFQSKNQWLNSLNISLESSGNNDFRLHIHSGPRSIAAMTISLLFIHCNFTFFFSFLLTTNNDYLLYLKACSFHFSSNIFFFSSKTSRTHPDQITTNLTSKGKVGKLETFWVRNRRLPNKGTFKAFSIWIW